MAMVLDRLDEPSLGIAPRRDGFAAGLGLEERLCERLDQHPRIRLGAGIQAVQRGSDAADRPTILGGLERNHRTLVTLGKNT